MRDPNRLDKFYDELKSIHKQHSHLRFGQFMMIVLEEMQSSGRDPFFPEEDEMITYIRRYFE